MYNSDMYRKILYYKQNKKFACIKNCNINKYNHQNICSYLYVYKLEKMYNSKIKFQKVIYRTKLTELLILNFCNKNTQL